MYSPFNSKTQSATISEFKSLGTAIDSANNKAEIEAIMSSKSLKVTAIICIDDTATLYYELN